MPAAGTISRSWGQITEAGPATGVSFTVASAARVVSPCGGRVEFASSFRSYGQLVIVDCGGGYAVVLAGFDRLAVRAAEALPQGAPIGTMPAWIAGETGKRPALYLELRHDGEPVNPAPWLRAG